MNSKKNVITVFSVLLFSVLFARGVFAEDFVELSQGNDENLISESDDESLMDLDDTDSFAISEDLFDLETSEIIEDEPSIAEMDVYEDLDEVEVADITDSFMSASEDDTVIYSANCGGYLCSDDAIATLYADGRMVISGTGNATFYTLEKWYPDLSRDQIISFIVEDGITQVTSSEIRLFGNCKNLESVTIADSVTKLAVGMFYECTNLTTAVISENLVDPSSLFMGCSSLTDVQLSSKLTEVGSNLFSGCSSLTEFICPETVTSIEMCAFEGCSSLEKVALPSTLKSIGSSAFKDCSVLTELSIPENCYIEQTLDSQNGIVDGCSMLEHFEVPNRSKVVCDWHFAGCSNMKTITIPENCTFLFTGRKMENTFADEITVILREGAKSIRGFESGWGYFGEVTAFRFNYPSDYPTSGYTSDEETMMENMKYEYHRRITKVILPDSLETIGETAFSCMYNLNELTIPDGVKEIGYQAFKKCRSLTKLTIPESVGTISDGAFMECTMLKQLILPETCEMNLKGNMFLNCSSLEELLIPEGTTSIEGNCFKGCSGLLKLCLPESVILMEGSSCEETGNIELTFRDGITDIQLRSRYENPGIISVTIPYGVKSITDSAFNSFSHLSAVDLPETLTELGGGTFYGCIALKSICLPEKLTKMGSYTFNYSGIESIEIPEGVRQIEERTFCECESLRDIVLPKKLTTIGEGAFYDCSSLEKIKFPGTLITIDTYAFYNCTGLSTLALPASINIVDYYAFTGCNLFESVELYETTELKTKFKYIKKLYLHSKSDASVFVPGYLAQLREQYGASQIIILPYGKLLDEMDELSDANVELAQYDYAYTGSQIRPVEIVTFNNQVLTKGKDYTVSYGENIEIGEGTVTITGMGDYKGQGKATFNIVSENDISGATAKLIADTQDGIPYKFYTGSQIKPMLYTVRMGSTPLDENTDYTVEYGTNVEFGEGTVTLTGIGEYTGHKTLKFRIIPETVRVKTAISDLPGEFTLTFYNQDHINLFEYDVQKDGESLNGYPDRIDNVGGIVGFESTVIKYINHLEEGENYTFRIRAIGQANGQEYPGLWEECEGEIMSVSLTPESGLLTADSNTLYCKINFGNNASNNIELTGQGSATLYDLTEGKKVSEFQLNREVEPGITFTPANGECEFYFSYDTRVIDLYKVNSGTCFLEPGHEYCVTISDNAFYFPEQEIFYGGFQDRGKWRMTTVDLDYSVIENPGGEAIPDELYQLYFTKNAWKDVKKIDDGTSGWCFGLGYAAIAWKHNLGGIKAIGGSQDRLANFVGGTKQEGTLAFYDFLQRAQILQYKSSMADQKEEHANDYSALYRAVVAHDPIVIHIEMYGNDKKPHGHVLTPIGIDPENPDVILVYDSNFNAREAYGYKFSFIQPLHLVREGGEYVGWYYSMVDSKLGFNGEVGTTAGNAHRITYTTPGDIFNSTSEDKNMIKATTSLQITQGRTRAFDVADNGGMVGVDGPNEDGFYYYWTDETFLDFAEGELPDNTYISLSNDDHAVWVKGGGQNALHLDLNSGTVSLTPGDNAGTNNYEVGFQDYYDYENDRMIDISGIMDKPVSFTKLNDKIASTGTSNQTIAVIVTDTTKDIAEENSMTIQPLEGDVVVIAGENILQAGHDLDQDSVPDQGISFVLLKGADNAYSGMIGETVIWEVNEQGTLMIYGEGDLPAAETGTAPWNNHADSITEIVIPEGITSIGAGVFSSLKNLQSVTLPATLNELGEKAFENCTGLTSLRIKGVQTILAESCLNQVNSVTIYYPQSWSKPQGVQTYGANKVTWQAYDPETGNDINIPDNKPGGDNITNPVENTHISAVQNAVTEMITISKKPTIKKPAAAKSKITVKWKHFKHTSKKTKKIWKKIKKVQVQCATDKAFKNIVKNTMVGKKKTKTTIKGLAKKTTYYVRVRYYDGTGYSAWSKVKKVKTK